MNNHICFNQAIDRLSENELGHRILYFESGMRMVISQWGGRVFGPFENEESESLLWMNKAFGSSGTFKNFLDGGEWNLGGDRIWLAPEITFYAKKRNAFFKTFTVQPPIDPGQYSMDEHKGEIALNCTICADVYEMTFQNKNIKLSRTIRKAMDPLHNCAGYKGIKDKVKYCGFEHEIYLCDDSPENNMHMETWNLTQVNPGGEICIPFIGTPEYINYYDDPDGLFRIDNGRFLCRATGENWYKLGFKAHCIIGRYGYINHLEDGRAYLYIKSFFNNPSSVYCNEPYDQPGRRGSSLLIYNDSGVLGGFTEMENCGMTIGGETKKNASTDTICHWFYIGDIQSIHSIANLLICKTGD